MKSFIKKGTTAIIGLLLLSTPTYSAELNNNKKNKYNFYYSTNVIEKPVLKEADKDRYLQQNLQQKTILAEANPKKTSSNLTNKTNISLQNNQSSLFTAANAAKILPANTALFGYINISSPDWQDMDRFEVFNTYKKTLSTYMAFLPESYENYMLLLQSLLGDHVAFAFLHKADTGIIGTDPNLMMLAAVEDQQALQATINKFKVGAKNIKEQEYKGIKILEVETSQGNSLTQKSPLKFPQLSSSNTTLKKKPKIPNKKQTLAIAIIPGYIAVATSVEPIKQSIDISTSRVSVETLFDNPKFQPTMKHPLANKAMFGMYQNPVEYVNLLEDIIKDPSLFLPPESLGLLNMKQIKEEVKQYNTINSFVTTQPEGLRFQVVAHRQKPLSASKVKLANITEEKILSSIPAVTYSAFTGKNINQTWQIISQLLSIQPKTAEGLKEFRNFFRSNTGLDFDKDIINWMDGEYAFFFYPTKGGFVGSNFKLGVALSFQTSNPQAVSGSLEKLDKFIQTVSKNEVIVSKNTIKGNSVTTWESPTVPSQSLLAYSWLDDNTVIITTGKGAIADLVPQPYVPLPSAYNFKTATSSLPRPNQGYFYMNMGSLLSWIYSFVPSESNSSYSPYVQMFKKSIGSIYSISSTSSITAEQEQFDLLVVLAPVRKESNKARVFKK